MSTLDTQQKIQDLAEALQSLESFELPPQFQSTNIPVDTALLERYQQAREQYLKRRIIQSYLSVVQQFDGKGFPNVETPTQEQWKELHAKRDQVRAQVQGLIQQIQIRVPQLQAQYMTLQSRQAEMQQVLKDLQEHQSQEENDDTTMDVIPTDEDISEEELQAQESELEELQQRKVEILQQIQNVQQSNTRIQMELQKKASQLRALNIDPENITPELLASLKERQAKEAEENAKWKDIIDFYDGLRQVLEELSGMKIIKVERGTDGLLMQVQFQPNHTLQIHLTASSKTSLRVSKAHWVTPTLLEGPANAQGIVAFSMNIPPVDDLVRLAAPLAPGDDLRFLLHQSLARVSVFTRRVQELSILQQQPGLLMRMGQAYYDPHGFGGQDQEIICSLNDSLISVVLRLGPECPIMPHSVTIAQLVGMGGWDTHVLQDVQKAVEASLDDRTSASPVQVIGLLKETLVQWQLQGKLHMPVTPKLPQRPKGF
jgi:predicted  nucleic acid-binding Zn-ribbon protein